MLGASEVIGGRSGLLIRDSDENSLMSKVCQVENRLETFIKEQDEQKTIGARDLYGSGARNPVNQRKRKEIEKREAA
jgi:hypothetical protein